MLDDAPEGDDEGDSQYHTSLIEAMVPNQAALPLGTPCYRDFWPALR